MVRYFHDGRGHAIGQGAPTGNGAEFGIRLNGARDLSAAGERTGRPVGRGAGPRASASVR